MGRITEKKLNDQRFRQTEESIIMAFLATKEALSVTRIIRIAGISRSTLYRHHRSIHDIPSDYEQYILHRYIKYINRPFHIKHLGLTNLYTYVLRFIYHYRQIFDFLAVYGRHDLIEQMIFKLKAKIMTSGKVTSDEMFSIYAKEVSALVEGWSRNGFLLTEIPITVDKIILLTNSANIHLSPIVNINSKSS